MAKSFRLGKSNTIGLIIADIANPFFASIARVVEDEAKRRGYTIIIGSSDEKAENAQNLLNVLIGWQVDGFIIVRSENSEEQILELKNCGVPFVLLDRYFPTIPTDFVSTNHYHAAFDMTQHLATNQYERIGMIAYKSKLFHMKERIRGYQDALESNKITFKKDWLKKILITHIEQQVKAAIDDLVSARIDALIFATYSLAINGLKRIR